MGVLVLFAAVTLVLERHLVRHPGSRLALAGSTGADHNLYAWYFEWVRYCVTHGANPLFSPAMNAPAGINVMWNTAVFPLALICLPLTATIGPYATVSVLLIASPFLTAVAAFFVLRQIIGRSLPTLGGRIVGPVAGAAVFAYSPFFATHDAHLNLVFAPLVPLIVLAVDAVLRAPRERAWRAGLGLGVAVTVEALVSEEVVVLLALGLLVAAVVAVAVWPREAHNRAATLAIGAGTALAVVAVLFGPLAVYQLYGPQHLHGGVTLNPGFQPTVNQLVDRYRLPLTSASAAHPASTEYTDFLGWAVVIAALAAALWLLLRGNRVVRWWLPTTVICVVLSLGSPLRYSPHVVVTGPWALVRHLPLLEGAVPTRMAMITAALLAGFVAYALARLSGYRLGIATLVVAACAATAAPPSLSTVATPPVPAFFRTSAVDVIRPGANVLVVPLANLPYVDSMSWQVAAHLRFNLVGGYSVFPASTGGSSYHPPALPDAAYLIQFAAAYGVGLSSAQLEQGQRSLPRAALDYVVIAEEPYPAAGAAAAEQITHCTMVHVADALVCRLPH